MPQSPIGQESPALNSARCADVERERVGLRHADDLIDLHRLARVRVLVAKH
jgi:hypothetical protein